MNQPTLLNKNLEEEKKDSESVMQTQFNATTTLQQQQPQFNESTTLQSATTVNNHVNNQTPPQHTIAPIHSHTEASSQSYYYPTNNYGNNIYYPQQHHSSYTSNLVPNGYYQTCYPGQPSNLPSYPPHPPVNNAMTGQPVVYHPPPQSYSYYNHPETLPPQHSVSQHHTSPHNNNGINILPPLHPNTAGMVNSSQPESMHPYPYPSYYPPYPIQQQSHFIQHGHVVPPPHPHQYQQQTFQEHYSPPPSTYQMYPPSHNPPSMNVTQPQQGSTSTISYHTESLPTQQHLPTVNHQIPNGQMPLTVQNYSQPSLSQSSSGYSNGQQPAVSPPQTIHYPTSQQEPPSPVPNFPQTRKRGFNQTMDAFSNCSSSSGSKLVKTATGSSPQ